MAYRTNRQRAEGHGSSGRGTEHHISMMHTAFILLFLVPFFVVIVARGIGMPYEDAIAYFGRPFPALIVGATLAVGFWHFAKGAQVLWEDYTHGMTRKVMIALTNLISLLLAGGGILSVIRIAL